MTITCNFRHRPDEEFQWEVYCDPKRNDVYAWCRNTFGDPGLTRRWGYYGGTIKLLSDRDKAWFLLKWGS